jgi:Peroxiredoxin
LPVTLPFLDRIAAGGGLPVIGISQDNAARTGEFRSAFGLSFPLLVETGERNYPVSNAYGISTVPSLFLIGKDGRIASAESGFSRRSLEDWAVR